MTAGPCQLLDWKLTSTGQLGHRVQSHLEELAVGLVLGRSPDRVLRLGQIPIVRHHGSLSRSRPRPGSLD